MGYLKPILSFFTGFFFNRPDSPSMKRLCGVLCVIFLCLTLWKSTFNPSAKEPPKYLVESIAFLAFGCLGLTSVEKFAKKKNKENENQ